MQKIGIFGGTFNPPHKEHINIAKKVVKELDLDFLIVVPTFISPHKIGKDVASKKARLDMLNLAFCNEKNIIVSDFELNNEGVSYSYITVNYFSDKYKDSKLYFLMGSDMLENFPTWKNPEIIASKVEVVLIERPFENVDTKKIIATYEKLYNKKVIVTKYKGEKVSSTEIRLKAKLNLPINFDTSEEIANYVTKNDVYKKDKYFSLVCEKLTENRRKHTYGVILTAEKLAKQVGADESKCTLSALLHDIAKYENVEDYNFTIPKNTPSAVAHQFLGEHICKTILDITDDEILNAVKYHTTGRENMSIVEKIVFVSDLIEENRTFEGVEELRKQVFIDFEKGFKLCIKELYKHLKNSQNDIYYLTKEAYDFYVKN